MAKSPTKPLINENSPLNNLNQTLKLDSKLSKKRDRKEYSKQRYQVKKQEYHEWYLRRKSQAEEQVRQSQSKYSQASAYRILMSLKEYTELNSQKHKLWLDFNWTLKDCQEAKGDIIAIMKLEQVANNLIRDYWDTAKQETKKGKSWNSLEDEEQERLIKYWGYEKARVENGYISEEERLEKQSKEYLKEIELAKFHEERGKIKCSCYACAEQKKIRKEVKAKIDKELKELEEQDAGNERSECFVCGKVKELDEETGACRKCMSKYE